MRKVITRTTEVACYKCSGSGAFQLPDGPVACPKCLGRGTIPSYFNEEVDEEEGKEETAPAQVISFS